MVDDLGLDPKFSSRDVRGYCADHDALRAFVIKREGAPDVGEQVKGIKPYGAYLSLHVSRGRGITLWDASEDVCWLLAYSETHASGEDRDCYQHFMSLGARDELRPTPDDYESLWDVSAEAVLEALTLIGRDLYVEARQSPGVEANRSYQDAEALMLLDLLVIEQNESEQGWICISLPANIAVGSDVIVDYLARLLPPHVDFATIEPSSHVGDRLCRYDEIAWTWTTYSLQDISVVE